MKKTDVIGLYAGPGAGKCHGKDTSILMHDGSVKKVQDIKIGDLIMGNDSTPRKVLKLFNGKDKMYKIIPNKGDPFTVTSNHILSLKFKHHTVKNGEKTVNFTVDDFIDMEGILRTRTKLYRTGVVFSEVPVFLDPYFLGLWLGDGLSSGSRISTADKEIVGYLKEYSSSIGLLFKQHSNKEGICQTYGLTVGNCGGRIKNMIMESLRELKLINNKHIPNSYKCNSKRVRLQLLAGLIDSDGYVNNKKNYIEITTKLPKLRDDILYLVRSLGYAGYSSVKNINDKNYYRINISGNLKEIPTKIKRKNIINNRTTHRNHLRTGFNIKYLGVDDYYGFELDGNHLYCLGDFTVTHNSTTATGVFSLLKMHGVNCEYASEYAKDRSWEESLLTCYNPYYICAKQYQRQFRLIGKVDVIITDSPLLLQCAYNDEKEFQDMALALFNKFNNINYIIKRKKAFNPKGRAHNLEESKKLDEKMYELLNRYNEPYLELEGDYNAVNFIVNKTLKRLDKEQKIFLGENVEVINETCSNT